MITNILVALDHTERAPAVLSAATEIAERFDARIHLLRVLEYSQGFPAAASNLAHPDELPAYLRAEAQLQLEVLAAGNARALREPPIIVTGSPSDAILETAERLGADLIVIGSHGYHALDRLFGTVAGRVANRAHRKVLVVHEE